MSDSIFWNYLAELTEQEATWREWNCRLASWHRFNTFCTHYLKCENKRARLLSCVNAGQNTYASVASVPVQLKDIMIYSLRRESFHQSLCKSLQIERPSGNKWAEFNNTWYLGDYSANKIHCPVYLTYLAATLPETISSLCRVHSDLFILLTPAGRGLAPEAQQLLTGNNFLLLSLADELSLQADGSFKFMRSISELMKPCSQPCPQHYQSSILPIEVYKYLVYNEK